MIAHSLPSSSIYLSVSCKIPRCPSSGHHEVIASGAAAVTRRLCC